jgi:GT2 family glycosyltransferase
MRIAALITCFNRREKTLDCLRRLYAQHLPPGVSLETVLVDDGSTDGTGEAVLQEFPGTNVIAGNGSLYWCGGMRMAWKAAASRDPEFYLLANDDTLLDEDAVSQLLEVAPTPDARVIAVAAIRDPENGRATYGGIRAGKGHVQPSGRPEPCDTFNGNAVLVPRAVFREIGMFHPAYTHGMGDFDYGHEATRHGIRVIQSAEFLGTCARNPQRGTWRDRSLGRIKRLRILISPKGLPFREWMTFNRRNSGWRWPLKTLSPYVRVLLGR